MEGQYGDESQGNSFSDTERNIVRNESIAKIFWNAAAFRTETEIEE
jgi:hypothetical protein